MPGTVRAPFPVLRLRVWVTVALVVGLSIFVGTMLRSAERLSDRFGPEVRADLEWRAVHGVTELARTADLGIAMEDAALVQEAFSIHMGSSDVLGIVAVNEEGKTITKYGVVDGIDVFAATPFTRVDGPGYMASWAPVQIEGANVGKIAMVVSTSRLSETHTILASVSRTTLIAGLVAFVFGVVALLYVTRAMAIRDAQLNDHAQNLEARVEDRTRELARRNHGLRMVLDNVAQGFIGIDRTGVMASERSAVVDAWFGTPAEGATLGDYMRAASPEFAAWFELGMQMLSDGIMPIEFCLEQLPKRLSSNGQTFEVSYSPITTGAQLDRMLVIISDVTAQLARERAEKDQHELITVFQRVSWDRGAGDEFLAEGLMLVDELSAAGDRVTEDRVLHTLKGTCGLFGFDRFAELCHTVETELADSGERLSEAQRIRILDGWLRVTRVLSSLLGGATRDVIEITRGELAEMVERARQPDPGHALATALTEWSYEPVARRFERFGQQAAGLALRLGKGELDIEIIDNGIRLDVARWTPLWSALVHAVRNAVDHGLVSDDRRSRDHLERARLSFAASRTDGHLVLSIADNGRGVDWEAIRARAAAVGIACESRRDLVVAMFADGFSTRTDVNEISGRGVGLSALRAAVQALGGTIDVDSELGKGTRFEMRFPTVNQELFVPPVRATHEAGIYR